MGFIKEKEYFIIKVVLKYQRINKEILGDALLNQYTVISSRITNLDNVKKYSYENIISNKLEKKRIIIYCIQLILILAIVGLLVFVIHNSYLLRYTGSLFNSNMYSVRPTDIDELKLSSENQEVSININEYNQIEKINEILIIKDTNLSFYISTGIVSISSFLFVFISFIIDLRRHFKIKKIRSYLKISN